MKDTIKGFFYIVIGCVILYLLLGLLPYKIYTLVKEKKGNDYILEEVNFEEMDEALKKKPSEIEGMSLYDKANAGMSPYSLDSDNDGLSDKDEVELYKSNPTSKSTAGDLYTDGYKVENGMDLFTAYEYEQEIELEADTCEEVTFTVTEIDDLLSVSESFDAGFASDRVDFKVYKAYKIYNNNNDVNIDLSSILSENNLVIDDVTVYIENPVSGEECKKAKYKVTDKTVTISEDFNDIQYVYIADKAEAKNANSLFNMFFVGVGSEDVTDTTETEAFGLVTGFPLLSSLGISKMNIYYNDTGNPDLNLAVVSKMVAAVNYQTSPTTDHNVTYEDESIQVLPLSELKGKYTWLQNIFPMFESNGDLYNQSFFRYCLFNYYTYDSLWSYTYDGEIPFCQDVDVKTPWDFDIKKDTLPFENFSSKISCGGNCMGIALLTAKLFNENPVPISGSRDIKLTYAGDGTITKASWDLSDDESKTLFDRGLSDYKDSNFVSDHRDKKTGLLTYNLSEKEQDFVNMIGSYWDEGNYQVKIKAGDSRTNGESNYNYYMIDRIKSRLDNRKILILCINTSTGGHAVNIYDYEDNADGSTSFYVYDNVYPGQEGLKFTVYPKNSDYDNHKSFDFIYEAPDYTFTSYGEPKYKLVVMDDNYEVILGTNSDGIQEAK